MFDCSGGHDPVAVVTLVHEDKAGLSQLDLEARLAWEQLLNET